MSSQPEPVPGGGLLHPVPILAIAVLVLNDHVFKALWPGLVTGKLSDLAGMAFFPLLLQGLWEAVLAVLRRPWRPSRRVLLGCAAVTGVVLAAIQVWEPAGSAWALGLALLQWPFHTFAGVLSGSGVPALVPVGHTADPTDLIALPALGVAVWAGWRRGHPAAE